MDQTAAVLTKIEGKSFIVERVFDAPRELVWDAWTKPEHLAQWWGHAGPLFACEIDLRVGGSFRFVQKGEDGTEYPFIGTYREVNRPERLISTMVFDMEPYNAHESVDTYTFEELSGGKTRLTMRTDYPSEEALQGWIAGGMEQGAIASMNRLADYVANMRM